MKRMQVVPFLVGMTCMGTRVLAGNVQSAAGPGCFSNTTAPPFSGTTHAPRSLTQTEPSPLVVSDHHCALYRATTAIYGWYPDRFSVKDSLRMGNYALLAAAGNIAREFLYGGPHTLLSQLDRPGNSGSGLDRERLRPLRRLSTNCEP